MCYPLNEDELIVNLKTGYDVKRVFIYYGDPFEAVSYTHLDVYKRQGLPVLGRMIFPRFWNISGTMF